MFQHPIAPLKTTTVRGEGFSLLILKSSCIFYVAFTRCSKAGRVQFPAAVAGLLGVSGPDSAEAGPQLCVDLHSCTNFKQNKQNSGSEEGAMPIL